MDKKLTIYMMTSTHWDREWYEPFQGFRWRLVNITEDAMDKLEANPEIETFTFDGQTIVLEDYLKIVPEGRERLQKLITDGRIKVGPWYVMPDEFIPSGESLVRNLQIGTSIAKEWGVEPMRYGYVCDIFGHTAQMPQILEGFDIKGALLSRGITDHEVPAHFCWEGIDGTRCLTFKTPDTLGYGAFWVRINNFDKWREPPTEQERDDNLKKFIDEEIARTDLPILMLVDGQDHRPLHSRILLDTKERLERLYPGCEVIITSPDKMLEQVLPYSDSLPVKKGELNSTNRTPGKFPHLLTNVLSSHYENKSQNDRCQTQLEKWAGPYMALSRLTGKKPLRPAYYDLAYRYLIQNHPHDSICGCSRDEIHRDMKYRYDQVEEITHSIGEYGMVNLSRCNGEGGDNTILSIFNPLPYRRRETVTVDLMFDRRYPHRYSEPFGYEPINTFHIEDKDGNVIPYKVTLVSRGMGYVKTGDTLHDDRHRVVFEADLAPGGITEYRIVPFDRPVRYDETLRTGIYTAENEFIKLTVNPVGSVDIYDKRTGETYSNQLNFSDDAELGDGWNHARPVANREYLCTGNVSVAVVCDAPAKCTFAITREVKIPCCVNEINERNEDLRRSAEMTTVTITANVSVTKSSPMVDVELTVNNTAKDHRLRLLVPTGVTAPTYHVSQAFCTVERPVATNPASLEWPERDLPEKSMTGFAYRREGNRGLAFVSGGGLHEIGVFDNEDGLMAVTLLRCFRRCHPGHEAIAGQQLWESTYRFGLLPMMAEDTDAYLQRTQDALATGIQYREDRTSVETPEEHSFFRLDAQHTVFSTMKVSEDREGIIIRLYNMSDKADTARLTFDRAPVSGALVNLEEQHPVDLGVKGDAITLEMTPWAIRTLYVKF
ncbi:MAG: hypothetical protein IKU51_04890 [Clostridia bacterium]|nr:hypothetical protein [Clostridia bacterium]